MQEFNPNNNIKEIKIYRSIQKVVTFLYTLVLDSVCRYT